MCVIGMSSKKREIRDIFLSYSRKDKARAQIIAEALKAQGYSLWWDMIILPGKKWDEVIKEALNSAKCVIVLWSHEFVLSDGVKEEAEYGKKQRILIPVLIDDVEIPFGFGRIQAAKLIDWEGDHSHPEFSKLLESVSKKVGRPPPYKKEHKQETTKPGFIRGIEEWDKNWIANKRREFLDSDKEKQLN